MQAKTLGELKASNYTSLSVKEELRKMGLHFVLVDLVNIVNLRLIDE